MFGPLGDVLRSRIMQARLDEVEKNRTTHLDIAHDEDRGVVVRNLTERKVTTPEEIFDVLGISFGYLTCAHAVKQSTLV